MITPYRVFCITHGDQFITHDSYVQQLDDPNDRWRCPVCNGIANWDDSWYENYQGWHRCKAHQDAGECKIENQTQVFYTVDGLEIKACENCPWFDYTEMDLSEEDYNALLKG